MFSWRNLNHRSILLFAGMRIITQSVPGGTSTKILPKPSQLTTPSGAPVVVVSAGSNQTATSTVAMINRPITTFSGKLNQFVIVHIYVFPNLEYLMRLIIAQDKQGYPQNIFLISA